MDRDVEIKQQEKKQTNPSSFDKIVQEVFAPIYPVITEQIVQTTKVKNGKCLDAGCGTGALGRSMAHITDLEITFFDQSEEMLELAKQYTTKESIVERSNFLQGDIHNIGLEDNSMDLVISRGSMPFWEDLHQAFSEILRVLKVGAYAYVGGGFGNATLRDEIKVTMKERNPNWNKSFSSKFKAEKDALPEIVKSLNPTYHQIIDDDSGFWVLMMK
ncbi:class I SAM-dependent methyltransferase [Sulfurimonas sp.]|uniref:class I SAM-dependent methyltransferase n=1 Tax=Sulfurimonas sp. TaxID=2022749 RepID=UPI003D129C0C